MYKLNRKDPKTPLWTPLVKEVANLNYKVITAVHQPTIYTVILLWYEYNTKLQHLHLWSIFLTPKFLWRLPAAKPIHGAFKDGLEKCDIHMPGPTQTSYMPAVLSIQHAVHEHGGPPSGCRALCSPFSSLISTVSSECNRYIHILTQHQRWSS